MITRKPVTGGTIGCIGVELAELYGLSTDAKPMNEANGAIFLEMDTKKVFIFDKEGGQWRPMN